MPATVLSLNELDAFEQRESLQQTFDEQAAEWSGSLKLFLEQAWHVVVPRAPFVGGYHIDAICEHLEAVTAGEIRRLVIAVPPGTTKSTTASICWPAWEWTSQPHRRFISASYVQRLATRLAVKSRDLIRSPWYQARWGTGWQMKPDEDLKTEYANTAGGRRLAIGVGTGTGEHGDVVLIDDPHDAEEILSDNARAAAIDWHDGTITTRFTNAAEGAEVIIAQRLHEADLIGHVTQLEPEAWTVLCLPERYERHHPNVTPALRTLESGRVVAGDPRTEEGELLCPDRIGPADNEARMLRLGSFRAAGQLQQRPAAREGEILKRADWQWFPREWLTDDGLRHLPRFDRMVQSWDTTFKDKTSSDYVAGQVWGVRGPDRFLLRSWHDRMSLALTKATMLEAHGWVEERWPHVAHTVLVEASANGPDVVAELRREVGGLQTVAAKGDKTMRAIAASPILESGNVFLPGAASLEPQGYDLALTPAFAARLVEESAVFPHGTHDDEVDAFTQMVNWLRLRSASKAKVSRARGRVPRAGSIVGAGR